ncbi:UNVERIFIED_CONTAM: hypothetical protein GTU68_056982 [Idotea baltica]|nr:hypothetical protein [Idotea baltica]
MGIEALKSIWHRGAVDADGKTGDGAGIHVQIPQEFFKNHIRRTGHEPQEGMLAVGQIFLPRTDFGAQETARGIVETEILRFDYRIYGWRQVPVNISVLGEKANNTRPEIEQIMIANHRGGDPEEFERNLYVIRRRIEKAVAAAQVRDFYVCSLSCRSIIYKGMMLAEQVSVFYPDLESPDFTSAFAIYHQRYSTNTFPQWWLAQPFRMLAHNGEINTLKGNRNWMRSHEIRMASQFFEGSEDDIKPIITGGASDSAALDAVFEVFVRAGRSAPMTKTMLVPEAWSKKATAMPDEWRSMYAYCNSVMEPWDGPAALACTDGTWVIAGMDRNGLRPMRYARTNDGIVVAGSEIGMVEIDEANIVEKGRVGPGQMIGVDMSRNLFLKDKEIKDELAASRPFDEWTGKITELDADISGRIARPMIGGEDLRRRQIAAGYSIEELEAILHPMGEDGKEAIGSMGDDTPAAVLSDQYRPLSHFFRQNFSQVTNPPIDPLREHRVMSLKTRFGNLKNVLEQDSSQTEIITLESPVVLNGEAYAMKKIIRDEVRVIDCLFSAGGSKGSLREAINQIRRDAAEAVSAGVGHIVLTDENANADNAAIPMILATSAVHSWLVRHGLRTFTSLNVRSAECLDAHYFAVLIGCGATTVNAWLAEESIRDRHERGLFGNKSLIECFENFRKSINGGLLKILSKMGISMISSYRGGCNFEAVGLSRALVAEYFPGMQSRISGIGMGGIQSKTETLHKRAFDENVIALPIGGIYKYRRNGENHAWRAELLHLLQKACDTNSFDAFKQYSAGLQKLDPIHLRDLLDFKPAAQPIPLSEVASITEIRKRFVTPGMSLGALSQEAHETLSIAMNRIGAKSDSGEGRRRRKFLLTIRRWANRWLKSSSRIRGRFGVTAE